MNRRLPILAVVTLAGAIAGAGADAGELTDRFFEGLRERRLFGLAEGYCLDRLASPKLEGPQRARLVVELSRTYAEHGRFRGGDERAELWEQAEKVLDEAVAVGLPAEHRDLVRIQRALLPAGQGEFLARQVEVFPFDDALRVAAIRELDDALPRLEKVVAELDDRRRKLTSSDVVVAETVNTWLFNVRLRLAVTRLDRAGLYEAGSPDRADLLNLATAELKALAKGDPELPATQLCHVLLARTLRLQGRATEAVFPLEELLKREPPIARSVRDGVELERARILLSLKRPDEAAQILLAYRRERGGLPGELRLVMTRSLIGLWNVVRSRGGAADEALERVRAQVRGVELELGGYWAVRARALLELAERAGEMGPELALLVQEAEGRFRSGDAGGAIAVYRAATERAAKLGRRDLAARFGYTTGSAELESGRFDAAAATFARVSKEFPDDERAARAGLLAAYALGRAYDADRTAARREAYVAALEAHRAAHPGDPTRAEATLMLARLQERRRQYTDAVLAYLDVPLDHPRAFEAGAGAARMYDAILGRLRELERPSGEWETSARRNLARYTARFGSVLVPLDRAQAGIAMRLAKLLSTTAPIDYAAADALLERVTATSEAIRDELPPRERAVWEGLAKEAAQLRIVALAGRGQIEQARRLIAARSAADPRIALDVLDGLTSVLVSADDRLIRELGRLQLAIAEPLQERRDELSADVRKRLDLCLFEGFFARDDTRRAIEVGQRVLAEQPGDEALAIRVARRLVGCDEPACFAAAGRVWSQLERKTREGTAGWFEARYHVILCALRSGDRDRARKLLGVTRTLHPSLGGAAWRPRFAALAAELAGAE